MRVASFHVLLEDLAWCELKRKRFGMKETGRKGSRRKRCCMRSRYGIDSSREPLAPNGCCHSRGIFTSDRIERVTDI